MNPVSYFSNYTSKEVREKHLEDIAEEIHSDPFLKSQTLGYRSCGVQSVKQQCPLFAVACRFSGGKGRDNIASLTGLSLVDIDHVEPERMAELRALIVADPHTLLCYTTVSGCGLRIIFPYHLDENLPLHRQIANYPAVFQAGNEYYQQLLGVETDLQCKNVTRLSGLAHDPEVYYNPAALELRVESGELRVLRRAERQSRLLGQAKRQSRAESFASRGSSANAQQGEATFNSPLSTSNSDSVCRRAHTLVERKEVYMPGNRHNFLTKLAFLCSDYGVPEADAAAYLAQYFPDYREESFPHLVASCYRSVSGTFGCKRADAEKWLAGQHKAKPSTQSAHAENLSTRRKETEKEVRMEQIASFLRDQPLRYDEVSRKTQWQVEKDGKTQWLELSDRTVNNLYLKCCCTLQRNFSFQEFRHALQSSVVPEVHPLRHYIRSLPQWHPGMPDYIGQVAAMVSVALDGEEEGTAKAELNALWASCFRKWFVAMVACWMDDKVVNHQVLVLIGEQGIYKTTWLEALIPPQLAPYRCKQNTTHYSDKDEQLRSAEFGFINLDEIDSMTAADLNALKALITSTDVTHRAPYAAVKETRVRLASYAASGNKERFLTDTTGNRRWLPFRVESILSPYTYDFPYEGMYAQAWYLIRTGFDYWFSIDETRRLARYVDGFMVESSEEQLLPVYFDYCPAGTPGAVLLTVAEISAKLTTYGNIKKPMALNKLGAVLKKLGYVSKRANRYSPRGYIVLEKSADSINAKRRMDAIDPNDEKD